MITITLSEPLAETLLLSYWAGQSHHQHHNINSNYEDDNFSLNKEQNDYFKKEKNLETLYLGRDEISHVMLYNTKLSFFLFYFFKI